MAEKRSLVWEHGVVSVEAMGGMLGPTSFVLPDGRQVAPMHIAPWPGDSGIDEQPAILRRLRGEWPCVPFGSDADRSGDASWPASHSTPTVDADPHGFSSNNEWRFGAHSLTEITLSIDYPAQHPIRALHRIVRPDPATAALDFELAIDVRADCTLPIGLHPSFRLPRTVGAMRIEVAPETTAMTFPFDVDATAIFAPRRILDSWNDVVLRDGGHLDISRVPLPQPTEELLQLVNMAGTASLWNTAEGYRVRLGWNPEHYPSALLWFSNRGRQMPPWNGRHLALGLEPICSAFDLGQQISVAANPISQLGVATARRFVAGERFSTSYRIAVEPADIL